MFEELLGKHCRLIQRDGYAKYGIITTIDDQFIKLELDDGRVEYISFDTIASVVEYRGGVR